MTLVEQRRALLTAALGFMQLDPCREPMPPTMTAFATSIPGPASVPIGMTAQRYDLQLPAYAGENWRATFFVAGMAHSIANGSAYEPTPWRAVQGSAIALETQPCRSI
jgi:hypothetical protein